MYKLNYVYLKNIYYAPETRKCVEFDKVALALQFEIHRSFFSHVEIYKYV